MFVDDVPALVRPGWYLRVVYHDYNIQGIYSHRMSYTKWKYILQQEATLLLLGSIYFLGFLTDSSTETVTATT